MAPKTQKAPAKVEQQKETLPAIVNDDVMSLLSEDTGAGMEGADKDSFAIPFIRILQQLSPQCTAGKTGYMPDAEPGQIFNTVTNELIDGSEGIIFIPCAFQRRFIQWGARSAGAGFKGEFVPEVIAEKLANGELVKSEDDGRIYFAGKTNPKKDDYFADTRSHFGLVLSDNGWAQALLSLSASQLKKSKQLMGILSAVRVKGVTPPTWMNKIRITTVQESNDEGSWWGVRVEHAGFVDSRELYEAGKAFYNIIGEGKARAEYHEETEGAPVPADGF
jgi:hypothetical protein